MKSYGTADLNIATLVFRKPYPDWTLGFVVRMFV